MITTDLLDATELAGLPEHCEEVLECPLGAPARCVAFNPAGTMVATGCVGGNILIWDYQTRGLIRTWSGGHRGDVLAMLWSEDGAQLFSGGSDGRLACWDVLQGSRETAWDLGRGAIRTLAHRSSQPAALLATFASGPAAVVELGSGACRALPFPGWQPAAIEGPALGSAPGPAPSPEADTAKPEPGASPGAARPAAELEAGPRSPATPADPEVPVKAQGPDPSQPSPGDSKRADPAVPSLGQAACCSPDGDVLFASARGALLVVRAADLAVVDAIRMPLNIKVSSLSLDAGGTRLLVLASDRAVRVFALQTKQRTLGDLPAQPAEQLKALLAVRSKSPRGSLYYDEEGALLRPSRRFEQQAERGMWGAARFSGDGEYVLASVTGTGEHVIYAWNAHFGHTDRILECPRECQAVVQLEWHPRPYPMQLLSLGGSGNVYIWTKIFSDRWTAFAPDFRELDENAEYVEREDEFDVMPAEAANGTAEREPGLDEDIDVVTKHAADSLERGADGLAFLPIVLKPLPVTPDPAADAPASVGAGAQQG